MKRNILRITAIAVFGVIVGLIFNAFYNTAVLTKQMMIQQGEILDLLRTMTKDYAVTKNVVLDLENKIVDAMNIAKKGSAPVPVAPERPQPPSEDLDKVYDLPIGDSAVKGKANAPITIVGFLDVQCPFSKRFQPVIDEVLEAYPGKVKYVVKNFPLNFHQQAVPAAKALMAAGLQGKYWEMLAGVLENSHQLSDEKYEEIAQSIGLNIKRFKKDLQTNDEAWDKQIQEDLALGLKSDVRGTPTYFLNGKMTKARRLTAFKMEIDKILEEK